MDDLGGTGSGRLEETKRLARILDLLQHLCVAPRRWTRRALAEKYEVSERQIQRDLTLVRNRLHLDLKRSVEGYYLGSVPRLPVVSYTLSEALALLLAAQAGREFGVGSGELASAIGRLESVLPREFEPLLRQLTAEEGGSGDGEGPLLQLGRALAGRRKLRLTYSSASR